jgi:hypothetical protein
MTTRSRLLDDGFEVSLAEQRVRDHAAALGFLDDAPRMSFGTCAGELA